MPGRKGNVSGNWEEAFSGALCRWVASYRSIAVQPMPAFRAKDGAHVLQRFNT